jgi:hypothetical protein
MNTPVSPKGAHRRLQHWPQPLHKLPSTPPLQLLAPAGGSPQEPTLAPSAMVQVPVQHSELLAHTSPAWVQYELPSEQLPFVHMPEQQSAAVAHSLPAVLQTRFKAVQLPASQRPLQHSSAELQAAASELQAAVEQLPAWQLKLEHSSPLMH